MVNLWNIDSGWIGIYKWYIFFSAKIKIGIYGIQIFGSEISSIFWDIDSGWINLYK